MPGEGDTGLGNVESVKFPMLATSSSSFSFLSQLEEELKLLDISEVKDGDGDEMGVSTCVKNVQLVNIK